MTFGLVCEEKRMQEYLIIVDEEDPKHKPKPFTMKSTSILNVRKAIIQKFGKSRKMKAVGIYLKKADGSVGNDVGYMVVVAGKDPLWFKKPNDKNPVHVQRSTGKLKSKE